MGFTLALALPVTSTIQQEVYFLVDLLVEFRLYQVEHQDYKNPQVVNLVEVQNLRNLD